MTAPALSQKLSEFCEFLVSKDLAINIQAHCVVPVGDGVSRMKWVRPPNVTDFIRGADVQFSEYMAALRIGDFSILMGDGGIIQVSVDFSGGQIVGHRLVYLPCPIHVGVDEIRLDTGEIYPLADFIDDLSEDEFRDRLRVRAPIRFEYDPANAGDGHPSSHLHLGRADCRIAVSCPLHLDSFLRFVFKRFYHAEFTAWAEINGIPHRQLTTTMTEADGGEISIQI